MNFQQFLKSKIGSFVLVLALIFVLGITSKLMTKKRDVENEIKKLQEQSEKISQENADLALLINYLNTDTYKERQAREQLNLKKEGEEVFVVVGVNEIRREEHFGVEESPVETKNELWENIYAWWRYFIH